MDFTFSEDQLLLQKTVRHFLDGECPVEVIRANWELESSRSPELWAKLAEIGLPGLRVAEEYGGLGLDETDLVLVLEETGRAALAEPIVSTGAVAAPLLAECGNDAVAAQWLPRIAGGEAIVAVGHSVSPLVSDAHVANLLILPGEVAVYAVSPEAVTLRAQPSNDPSRRLFTVQWSKEEATLLTEGDDAHQLRATAFDRGAWACSAEALGVCDRLIAMSVEYASQRKQFGVPIGSFQAVKHHLADVKVKLEYARSLVYRAAHSIARGAHTRSADVSMAKVAACEAATLAARTALQVHGAIGYTWEQDLHVWMRRAWTLDLAWGAGAWHRNRVAEAVLGGSHTAESFGYQAPAA
jgi:alkylation response protein AidB-like acyl-CoA dehydrogenase